MLNLILIRHGNTFEANETVTQVGFKTDLPLTTHGEMQIQSLSEVLKAKDLTPQTIYSGSLKRQKRTAMILKKSINPTADLIVENALDEIDYGLWENKTTLEIKTQWPSEHKDWTNSAIWPKQIFNGDLTTHLNQIENWLNCLLEKHEGETIFAVSSNGIIRLFLYFSNLRWKSIVTKGNLIHYKVSTGHYCHLSLERSSKRKSGVLIKIQTWNQNS